LELGFLCIVQFSISPFSDCHEISSSARDARRGSVDTFMLVTAPDYAVAVGVDGEIVCFADASARRHFYLEFWWNWGTQGPNCERHCRISEAVKLTSLKGVEL
jgi:hypothetical protein